MTDKKGIRKVKVIAADVSWPLSADRYAVSRLTRGKGVEAGAEQRMQAAADLTNEWRARLLGLRLKGWKQVEGNKKYTYAANCPSAIGLLDQMDLRPCMFRQVCPSCWCREYVMELYRRFENYLFPPDAAQLHMDLIEVVNTWRYDVEQWHLKEVLDWVKESKQFYYRDHLQAHCPAAFVLCSVEPPIPGKKGIWELKHRILAAIESDDGYGPLLPDVEELDHTVTRTVRRTVVNKKSLAAAVGRVCLYPERMLRGGVEKTVEILNLLASHGVLDRETGKQKRRGGYRMSAYYGALRERTY